MSAAQLSLPIEASGKVVLWAELERRDQEAGGRSSETGAGKGNGPAQSDLRADGRADAVRRESQVRRLPDLPSRVERRFAEWIASDDGSRVVREVVERARRLLARGHRHFGIAALWEAMRYDAAVAVSCGERKLDNSFRAPLARRVMQEHPDLADVFRTRKQRRT